MEWQIASTQNFKILYPLENSVDSLKPVNQDLHSFTHIMTILIKKQNHLADRIIRSSNSVYNPLGTLCCS